MCILEHMTQSFSPLTGKAYGHNKAMNREQELRAAGVVSVSLFGSVARRENPGCKVALYKKEKRGTHSLRGDR